MSAYDPEVGWQIGPKDRALIVGNSGSGKSIFAHEIAENYEGDRVIIIDPTMDDIIPELRRRRVPADAMKVVREVPSSWPTSTTDDGETIDVRYVIIQLDSASPTFYDDIDAIFAWAYRLGDLLLWVDEVHTCCPSEQQAAQRFVRRALVQGRHRRLSIIACGPRPVLIAKLWINQAHYIVVFLLPLKDDRAYIALNAGFDPPEIHNAHAQLEEHGHIVIRNGAVPAEIRPPLKLGRRQPITHQPRKQKESLHG
jgi:DNA helicase HerA-like ATPase